VTTFVPDVNVLIALVDPAHTQHDAAHEWFGRVGHRAWATCPLTENGVLRIVGHARDPNSPGSPAAVVALMTAWRALPGHVFWPDDVSLFDPERIDASRLLSAAQVTDSYLLALACAQGGMLASFDRRLVTDAVRGGGRGLLVLG
jgi:toxin-antitoxin system PIN domain toxin